MTEENADGTPLARLVRAADETDLPVEIGDRVFMSEDVSNSYAVGTDEGYLLINTGTRAGGPRHYNRYRNAGLGKVASVVLTQHHTDHVGGLQAFLGDKPPIITDWRFPEGFRYHTDLEPYYAPRQAAIWGFVLGDKMPPKTEFEIVPDILVDRNLTYELGSRRFEFFSTPGGETLDSLCIWMPKEKIVFTGNLFGPAFLTIPNVNTLRLDKPRSVVEYLRNVDRVARLGAEILITGHGEPIRGKAQIENDVVRIRNCVHHIHDQTLLYMREGRTLEQAMREITMPQGLELREWYGTVSWTVKTIWREYTGWWDQVYTSELYPVAITDRYSELVELAGRSVLAARAVQHLDAGRTVEGLQLLEILLTDNRQDELANQLLIRALNTLLKEAGVRRNLQETVWLRGEINRAEKRAASSF